MYSLILGQCTDIMRQKIESHDLFAGVSSVGDGLGLLKLIKGVAFQFQSQKYLPHALHEALKRYYNSAQGKFANTQAYLEQFQNVVAVVTESGGSVAGHDGVENTIIAEGEVYREDMTEAQLTAVKEEATAQSTAMAFLLGCDRSRYGRLIDDLENVFLQNRNHYPKTVAEAYNLLTNWKQERTGCQLPTVWHSPTWTTRKPHVSGRPTSHATGAKGKDTTRRNARKSSNPRKGLPREARNPRPEQ